MIQNTPSKRCVDTYGFSNGLIQMNFTVFSNAGRGWFSCVPSVLSFGFDGSLRRPLPLVVVGTAMPPPTTMRTKRNGMKLSKSGVMKPSQPLRVGFRSDEVVDIVD